MQSHTKLTFLANHRDSELEWLLCLAAALQAREQRPNKPGVGAIPAPAEPKFARGTQALLKGLSTADPNRPFPAAK